MVAAESARDALLQTANLLTTVHAHFVTASALVAARAKTDPSLAQLARNLAAELGPRGIRVNAIAPGLVKTDFAKALWSNPQVLNSVEARAPLRRIGQPVDIAGIAVFLASKAARPLVAR